MAILTMWKSRGDPDELFARATEKVAPKAREVGEANGRISTTIAKTDDGLLFVNVWETEEGMRRTAEEIGPIAREAGMPEQIDWQQHEVLVHEGSVG